MAIEDDFCSLMNPETFEQKDDLKAPEGELGAQIREAYEKSDSEGADVLVRWVWIGNT